MALPKGIINVAIMRRRKLRGGNDRQTDSWDRSKPDSLALWRDAYLESLAARNYSENTLESRVDALKVFLSWAAERELSQAAQITRPMLEAYQRWLSKYTKADGKRLGWSTQRARLSAIKDWFRWLTKRDVILHNPASELEMPRQEKRLPGAALSPVQLAALMALPNVADPLGMRDRAMLELFYSTGMRRVEVCRLELPDFNAQRGTIHVRKGKGKKDRMVPVGEQAIFWIEKYLVHARPRLCLDTRTQAVFLTGYGGPFHPDVLSRYVSKWMKEAGLHGKGSCHMLRHTCATHMLEGGADIRYIQQLLGHESLETTAIYTAVDIRKLQEVHARCHPTGRVPAPENAASAAASGV
jgi:integrase/recombinase XerD